MKPNPLLRAILAVAALVLAAGVLGCGKEAAKTPCKLTVAMSRDIYSGLISVAQEQGFFKAQGLEVELKPFASGYGCLKELSQGKADIATAADLAFASFFWSGLQLRTVASIASFSHVDIVVNRDKRISASADLAGKRIGVPASTGALYTLETFLQVHGIPQDRLTVVDTPPDELPAALASGQVDAICVWGQFAWRAKKLLGDKAVSWPAQNSQPYHWLLVTRGDQGEDGERMRRFLRALLQAQEFALKHPRQAQAAVAKELNYSEDYMQTYWERSRLSVTLDQSLVDSLENAARWHLSQAPKAASMPNVLHFINPAPLTALDAQAVTYYH